MLHNEEQVRYSRQLAMPEIGSDGQEKLLTSTVAIVGVGGLGCAVATCLAGAGVGKIKLIDCENIELSNLNRQFLYKSNDIGSAKAEIAANRLSELNDSIKIEGITTRIMDDNAREILSGSDVIVDCLDSFETRFLINRIAIYEAIPLIHGACCGFEGRVMTIIPTKTACLKCAITEAPNEKSIPIIGSTAVFVGAIQASEVIKHIIGFESPLVGKMLFADIAAMRFSNIAISKNSDCEICGRKKDEGSSENSRIYA